MSSHFPARTLLAAWLAVAGCSSAPPTDHTAKSEKKSSKTGLVAVGAAGPVLGEVDPRIVDLLNSKKVVMEGKTLYSAYNCSGCHSNGGGGMGPALMDDTWIYGGRIDQIHDTIKEGRPNGMPRWEGKIPDRDIWKLATYVRSMSLPATLAAARNNTPSQDPTPVPIKAEIQ